jgi:hypothetical protein
MADLPYDPAHEKDRLAAAHSAVHKYWGTTQMGQACEELARAIAHAEHVLSVLTSHYETEGIAFRVHLLGLGCMTQYARDELEWFQLLALTLVKDLSARPPSAPLSKCPAD